MDVFALRHRLVEDYAEHPRTIVLSSHLIDEVANLIERVILIDGGSILGTVNGGAGRDKLTFTTQASQVSTLAAAQILNFEDIVTNGAGTLNIASNGSIETTVASANCGR